MEEVGGTFLSFVVLVFFSLRGPPVFPCHLSCPNRGADAQSRPGTVMVGEVRINLGISSRTAFVRQFRKTFDRGRLQANIPVGGIRLAQTARRAAFDPRSKVVCGCRALEGEKFQVLAYFGKRAS